MERLKYSQVFEHNAKVRPKEHRHHYELVVGMIHSGTHVKQCRSCLRWEAYAVR